jgi:glycosyltransferase involved in cell wall biosynthesis
MIWLLVDSSTVGGIERHVATLAQALIRAGHEARILLLADHGANPWLDQLRAAGLPYRFLDNSLNGLLSALRAERPALLHTHGYKANILGRIAARLARVPVVATFHAGERGAFPVGLYQMADAWTSILGGRISVSTTIAGNLPYASVLTENFLLSPSSPPARPLSRRIGFVGRLSHEKAPDLFCALAARCAGAGEWHVYGDGPMRAELEAAYGKTVRFHGLVTDLEPVWASLGLLVMPSRAEGLPMAALEALAAGVPIAASEVGGLPSVVKHGLTGWLFPAGDMAAAEAAVGAWSALSDASQLAMRKAAYSLLVDKFSERRQLPAILDVYRRAGFTDAGPQARAA